MTIGKLVNNDIFGLEKYLGWGVDVQEMVIRSSEDRLQIVDQMESYFNAFGLRKPLLQRCAMVAEELLMNALYDAPCDQDGKPLYNHLPRTEIITLQPGQTGRLRYACDGMLLAVSAIDPFGSFDRQTLIDYLAHHYLGKPRHSSKGKGGAGYGLFQIMQTSNFLVINVQPGSKTEVIAVFKVDLDRIRNDIPTSLHFFQS